MRLLILGATGLVGRHLLDLALADGRVAQVVAPTRREAGPPRERLLAPRVDFERLPEDADWWAADAVACALGTTMRQAGSREAFRRVDHDHPLQAARLARAAGARAFVLVSAAGANPRSRFFYNRVKGELERDLKGLGFPSLTLVRPGLIGGERREIRPAERAAALVLGALGPVLPRGLRINPAAGIARAMLEAAVAAREGVHVVRAADLA